MNRCPITYQLCKQKYSIEGLKKLTPKLGTFCDLAYTAEELRLESARRSGKMSIQGVQPKLSAILNIKDKRFDLVDMMGKFILKPQHHIYPQLPENEDLTMHLASIAGIEVPLHGMIYSKDDSLTYYIKRFDRTGRKDKLAVEDFAQLAGLTRDTKYNYTIEKLIKLIEVSCTFPLVEKVKLFKRIIFNFLIGNEDMHLKNYSIIHRNYKIELSPAYDFLNSTIVLSGDIEETALQIKGKKKNLNSKLLINYLGSERMQLNSKVIKNILNELTKAIPFWQDLIQNSFLSKNYKEDYLKLLNQRLQRLGMV
ncbi:MAG: HipA domain-containing protein [Bacteroidota bacterium]